MPLADPKVSLHALKWTEEGNKRHWEPGFTYLRANSLLASLRFKIATFTVYIDLHKGIRRSIALYTLKVTT